MRKKSDEYQLGTDAIRVMTMKVSKGLEFPLVALPGVGHMPATWEDEKEAARVFYVAASRATQKLVIGVCWKWTGEIINSLESSTSFSKLSLAWLVACESTSH